MLALSRPLFGCALLCAVPAVACSTQEVRPDPKDVMLVGISSAEYDSAAAIFVIRDDAIAQDASLTPRNLPPYSVMVDGRFAAWDETTFVQAGASSAVGFTLPAGSHVIALVDDHGQVAVTSPPMQTRPGFDPATNPVFNPAVVFFGGATSLRARVLIDDPTLVPEGLVRVRLMNALADHQPIQAVQCPTDIDSSPQYAAGACTPLGDPIAYGDVFERDAGPDVVNKLGYYWAPPGAVDSVVMSMGPGHAFLGMTRIPTQVAGPGHSCPSCVFTEF